MSWNFRKYVLHLGCWLSFLLWATKTQDTAKWVDNSSSRIWHIYIKSSLRHHILILYHKGFMNSTFPRVLEKYFHHIKDQKNFDSATLQFKKVKSSSAKLVQRWIQVDDFVRTYHRVNLLYVQKNASGDFLFSSDMLPSAQPGYRAPCNNGFMMKDDCNYTIWSFLAKKENYPRGFWYDLLVSKHLSVNITFDQIMFLVGLQILLEDISIASKRLCGLSQCMVRRSREQFYVDI